VARYGAKRAWVMLLGSLALSAVDDCMATTTNKELCEDEWTHLQQVPAVTERLRQWSALSAKCENSGLYESRLARLNILAGRFEEARRVTQVGLALKSPYGKELLSTAAEIDLNQMKLDTALLQYEAIIKSYPDYYDGYAGVGTVKLMQNNFTEAVTYLNQATAHGKVPVYIYRNLIIAHHQLGENQQAIDAVNTAYKVDKDIVKDKDAMNAAARSYIFIGKYHAADGTLKMLVKANPEAANDPQIRETMSHVAKKLQEEKQS
jgi:tetratricopeptide (TPR) repeat protein